MPWQPWLPKEGYMVSFHSCYGCHDNYGCHGCRNQLKNLWNEILIKMTMNYSTDGLRVSHHEQKYFCSFCNFKTHKKYNLEVHEKNKHGTLQTGSGALLSEQTIPHHVPQEILHENFVPIETYNHVFRQWQG